MNSGSTYGSFRNVPKPLSAIKLPPIEISKKPIANAIQDLLLIEKQMSTDSF